MIIQILPPISIDNNNNNNKQPSTITKHSTKMSHCSLQKLNDNNCNCDGQNNNDGDHHSVISYSTSSSSSSSSSTTNSTTTPTTTTTATISTSLSSCSSSKNASSSPLSSSTSSSTTSGIDVNSDINSTPPATATLNDHQNEMKNVKTLKSLLKKSIDPKQDFIKSHNKRVKFSETMQVFCYEMPDNQIPQTIALKQDNATIMESFQSSSFMYDPPIEYQDLLTFEPPPDYRDFIANSLNVFRNEVTFDFIDDDDDEDDDGGDGDRDDDNISNKSSQLHQHHSLHNNSHYSHHYNNNHSNCYQYPYSNEHQQHQQHNSKWESMILNNNLDCLEEEQIIGVLKEDDILQAIGSHVTLPESNHSNHNRQIIRNENDDLYDNHNNIIMNDDTNMNNMNIHNIQSNYDENLSSADFPVHHIHNSYYFNQSGQINDMDDDDVDVNDVDDDVDNNHHDGVCCIDSSSPNGSLQDLASDSSITSQDTIILIQQNNNSNQNLNNQNNVKTFHIDSMNNNNANNNNININIDTNNSSNNQNRQPSQCNTNNADKEQENIYENLQPTKECSTNTSITKVNYSSNVNSIVVDGGNVGDSSTTSKLSPVTATATSTKCPSPTPAATQTALQPHQSQHETRNDTMKNEVLYENTDELLLKKLNNNSNDNNSSTSIVSNQIKSNFEHQQRLSTSSSDDGGGGGGEFSSANNNNPSRTSSKSNEYNRPPPNLGENISFYGKIIEQQQQNHSNSNKSLNDSSNNSAPTITINMPMIAASSMTPGTAGKFIGKTNNMTAAASPNVNGSSIIQPPPQHQQQHHTVIPSVNNLMSIPCYAVLDTSNRTSSSPSSSLSSASSSSTSSSAQTNPQTLPLLISTSTSTAANIQQIKPQISPNSNSPNSSTSSSSASSSTSASSTVANLMMNHEQFLSATKSTNNNPSTNSTVQQIHIKIPDNNINGKNVNLSPPDPQQQSNMAANHLKISANHLDHSGSVNVSPRIPTNAGHICIINNQSGAPAAAALRPGQVIYRYPSYAVIQHPGMNGLSTIRPVQYIVQTAPNTANNNNPANNQASIIYNSKLLVGNQLGQCTISSVQQPSPASNVSGSSPSSSSTASSSSSSASSKANNTGGQTINVVPKQTAAAAIIQQAQIVVPNTSVDANQQSNAIPVRHIIVPQGTTLLGPRIMQLHHPQHKQHPAPPSYCYVQQKHPTVMAYTAAAPNLQPIRPQHYPINNGDGNNIQLNHHSTHFPDPSEIRRRDGLYAYPQVLMRKDGLSDNNNNNKNTENSEQSAEEKDELEAFVQQEHQRTERIKKRYSFTEDDDPTFGFARRPSVRGIRSKIGHQTNNEQAIIHQQQQQQSTMKTSSANTAIVRQQMATTGTHQQQPHPHPHPIFIEKQLCTAGTLPKNLQQHHQQQQQQQFIQINHVINNNNNSNQSQYPHMISIVKKIDDLHVTPMANNQNNAKNILAAPGQQQQHIQQMKSQTLPRRQLVSSMVPQASKMPNGGTTPQHEIVRIIDANMLNGPNPATASRDQLKLQAQKTMEPSQQQQQQQPKLIPTHLVNANHPQLQRVQRVPQQPQATTTTFSPNHPNSNNNEPTATTILMQQTSKSAKQQHQLQQPNDKMNNLVNNNNNNSTTAAAAAASMIENNNKSSNDSVYYSMNV